MITQIPHFNSTQPSSSVSLSEKNPHEALSPKRLAECRDILAKIGSPKDPKSRNTRDTDYIVRAVMRHPSQEAIQILSDLHKALRIKFLNQSDEGINWLLGGCSSTARGGFKNASSVKKFLESPPESIPSSRLITGLETLITTIAYRVYKDSKATPPHNPETPEQQSIYSIFDGISPAYRVSDHSNSYPDSRKSLVFRVSDESRKYLIRNPYRYAISLPRDDLSEGSGSEDGSLPSRRFGAQVFEKKLGQDRTWIGAASAGNIPIRIGISGSTTVCLSTIEWLLEKPPGGLDRETAELVTAVLIIPTFVRGDYHSVAEITAALQHFLACRKGGDPSSAVLSPHESLKKGLSLLCMVIDPKFKESLEKISLHILQSTTPVPYPYREEEDATTPLDLGTPALDHQTAGSVFIGAPLIADLPFERRMIQPLISDNSEDDERPKPAGVPRRPLMGVAANAQVPIALNLGAAAFEENTERQAFLGAALVKNAPLGRRLSQPLISDSSEDDEGPKPAGVPIKPLLRFAAAALSSPKKDSLISDSSDDEKSPPARD